MSLFLIRLGELTLKKGSRAFFEKILKRNIKDQLQDLSYELKTNDGRYYLYVQRQEDDAYVAAALSRTFGIADFHIAYTISNSMPEVKKGLIQLIANFGPESASFKIETKRINKSFPTGSYETCQHLGAFVLESFPHLRVDVHNPDWTIVVEIREKCYVYAKPKDRRSAGPGGLPVGTAGRGLLMLSGGIDSPVAGWMMAKRGLQLLAVHFHTPPYTGCEALQKVRDLAGRLAPWNTSGCVILYLVNFTQVQLKILNSMQQRYATILARSYMMRIAELIAKREEASVLITGEALSQVASQTLDSLSATDQATKMLILRPLIGMDKQDIISLADHLDSFQISIQTGTDCCVLFAPDSPMTHPKVEKVKTMLDEAALDELLQQAAHEAEREVISVSACLNGPTER